MKNGKGGPEPFQVQVGSLDCPTPGQPFAWLMGLCQILVQAEFAGWCIMVMTVAQPLALVNNTDSSLHSHMEDS